MDQTLFTIVLVAASGLVVVSFSLGLACGFDDSRRRVNRVEFNDFDFNFNHLVSRSSDLHFQNVHVDPVGFHVNRPVFHQQIGPVYIVDPRNMQIIRGDRGLRRVNRVQRRKRVEDGRD
ncbi:hypothetical protein CVT24_012292 [Panaeolus cyanescens]|uniref:Uncharacterized protein n=1 Tax=Panaeolus cyanescens TaxID=181874 RepID=A0A409X8G4_9AGAR|nr:hypothetical protein CVT24_012292 [Panaeolus cyanescens]